MRGAHEHAIGHVALIGDAAHPMLPYLAQGAGMAIEDAFELAHHVPTHANADVQQGLLGFAQARWQRNARVQQRAMRNGNIFHAQGPVRFARDMGLRVLGARLMDVPWLYGYNAGKL
jgi:salicylate hydroxylase